MSAPIPFSRLTSAVVNALRYLPRTAAGQCVITVEADRCEIDWRPEARFHHAMLLPLILLTAALDEGAAMARWRDVSFAKALSTAPAMDGGQKAILLALAGVEDNSEFDQEVVSWADRFDLAGSALTIDRADVAAHSPNGHYCIEPMSPLVRCQRSSNRSRPYRRLPLLPFTHSTTAPTLSRFSEAGGWPE